MDLRSSFAIGEIVEINYWMRTVSVVSPPGGYASLSDVKVIDSINLGTKGEPIVTSGQKVLILRPSRQDRFLAIEIDPQIEKPITKLSDLIKCAHTLATIHETSDIWWRGHDHANWTLVPDVFRNGRTRKYERTILARFKQQAKSRHSNCPPDNNLEEWHFLMRHFGLRTRLLDWTDSPLVAAFFAVTSHESETRSEPEPDASIWALNPLALNGSQTKTGELVILGTQGKDNPVFRLFLASLNSKVESTDEIYAISSTEIDIRMLVQFSQFTIHGSQLPLERLPGSDTFVHKLTIPAKARNTIRGELDLLGIRLHNLFPDLEHLAKYLNDIDVI